MIKFFRKIRLQLLSQNRISKYIFYAIGEIVLVMVGILLALQVNNWNEERKMKIKEVKTLKELSSDLTQNLIDINDNINSFQNCLKSNEIIIYHIENQLQYNDSLNYHFSMLYPFITFSVNQTTYDNLKQIGMDLITDDSIRHTISDLYANQFTSYKTFESTYMVNHFLDNLKPIFMSQFSSFDYTFTAKPINYDELIKNVEFKQSLNFTVDICNSFISMQTRLGGNVKGLKVQIDKEISSR